jgi:mono/diheme cytochrome c family protein
MRTVLLILVLLVLGVAGAVGFAYSGLADVSAVGRESGIVRWLLATTREQSVSRRAEGIQVPDLTDDRRVAAGAAAFDDMCAGCHGAPGRDPFTGAGDMSPPPPDLGEAARARPPAELFWIIKHGIRMTGMPAWGPTHSDEELWDLVAFVERLPGLGPDAYRGLADTGTHAHAHGEEGGHSHDGHPH